MVHDLRAEAEAFAAELTRLLHDVFAGVLDDPPSFVAVAAPERSNSEQRVSVSLRDSVEVPLMIDGEHWLNLVAEYQCHWDHVKSFLAVRSASISVAPARKGAPLFRYEFIADMNDGDIPCAHLHVHAHRDEFLIALLRGEKGRPKARTKQALNPAATNPQLSDVHFPLGGPRMRPSLEDVIQMLMAEFAIQVSAGAKEALDESRAEWRRKQIGSAVRDAPAEAGRVLTSLGYSVTPPPDGEPAERVDKLMML